MGMRCLVFGEGTEEAKSMKECLRTVFVEDDGSEIYVPAIMTEDPLAVMAVLFDGVPYIQEEDCAYVPLSWVVREYPGSQGAIGADKLRANVMKY